MKKISNGAGVLLIVAAMILSAVAVTADTEELVLDTYCVDASGSVPGAVGPIVWDNGMEYYAMLAAQYDPVYQELGTLADDFHFDEDTDVADIHWVGGYWNTDYQTGDFDWNITFYADWGNGEAPGAIIAGPYIIPWDEIGQELLVDTGSSIYYKLSADLPEVITFPACEKFWVSIRGEGAFPPQSGTCAQQSVLLHMAVWKSSYFEVPDWLNVDEQWPEYGPMDMCFQLTGPLGPVAPTPPIIDGPRSGAAGTELCWTFHSSDENGDQVKYFIDWGDGSTDETGLNEPCTPVEVCHTYADQGTFTITAYAEDATGETSGSSTFDVEIPRARSVIHPLLLRVFERFPNAFTLIRQLLGI
ncbi:MAG: PKD domain-containing protein [Thermoplasmatales archaeon]|nr:MAG: PKD domain-containing protein [Thermoplasmatales archaeon]